MVAVTGVKIEINLHFLFNFGYFEVLHPTHLLLEIHFLFMQEAHVFLHAVVPKIKSTVLVLGKHADAHVIVK